MVNINRFITPARTTALIGLLWVAAPGHATAQSIADFYSKRSISILVGFGPGGGSIHMPVRSPGILADTCRANPRPSSGTCRAPQG